MELYGAKYGVNGKEESDNLLLCNLLSLSKSVQDESRTHTPNRALPPQSSASTNSATSPFCDILNRYLVPRTGLEPARRETHAPETCASTNSATWANSEYSECQ